MGSPSPGVRSPGCLLHSRLFFWAACLLLAGLFPSCGGCSVSEPQEESLLSPLTAEQELQTFKLAEGFEIDLVASDPDMLKIVDIAFDDSGRMWAVTASEYPMDQNDTIPAIATNDLDGGLSNAVEMVRENQGAEEFAARYRKGGRDQVLVFDTPTSQGRQVPRVFAEKMFIPLSVLPVRDGVLVCQGPDILLLQDSDGDGRADSRKTILTGFGVQDSHNNEHRLTRGPGGWIYFAQGGFTLSQVQTPEGDLVPFNATKVGRFRPDGTDFNIFSYGLLNVWGLVIDRQGDTWIQEANDVGYPVVPVTEGTSYPGIGRYRAHPYSPWYPAPADFRVGGTGLSGLAMTEDAHSFPEPFLGAMLLANPITRAINSVQIARRGNDIHLEQGQDLLTSSDPWFRPVALYFGPDGALYIVDWYNKIISHNEVARTHPDRDKVRTRIWRVRHRTQEKRSIPDLTKVPDGELLRYLKSDVTWEARAAWHQIADRGVVSLIPGLKEMAGNGSLPVHQRLLALWTLEELGDVGKDLLEPMLSDPDRAIRRHAVRILRSEPALEEVPRLLTPLLHDPDSEVRLEVIRTLGAVPSPPLPQLLEMVEPPLEESGWARSLGERVLTGASYRRAFERSLIRAALENHPSELQSMLNSSAGPGVNTEQRLMGYLALGGREGALAILKSLPGLQRDPSVEEVIAVVQEFADADVRKGFARLVQDKEKTHSILLRLSLFNKDISPAVGRMPEWKALLGTTLRSLFSREPTPEIEDLLLDMVSSYRLSSLEPQIVALLQREGQSGDRRLGALKALLEIGSQRIEIFQQLAADREAGRDIRRTAIAALAGSENPRSMGFLIEIWERLDDAEQRIALTSLTSTPTGAHGLLDAIAANKIPAILIDTFFLDRLKLVLGKDDSAIQRLEGQLARFMEKVLELPGGRPVSFCDTDLVLEGPFTVESWLKLDEPIGAGYGLLGDHVSGTFNFGDGHFRVTLGSAGDDLIVSRNPVPASQWFHLAVTRDGTGEFRIFINGAPDKSEGEKWNGVFKDLDIGRTQPLIYPGYDGTKGMLMEFRVWDVARTDRDIWENYERSFAGEELPPHLTHYFNGESWGTLRRGAKVVATQDFPPLLTAEEVLARKQRFEEILRLAGNSGDVTRGRALFKEQCMVCHRVGNEGADVGPVLDGAAANGVETLVRSVLTPNAGVEPAFRTMRVITNDNQIIEGMLAEESPAALTIRQPRVEDTRIPQETIRRAYYLSRSVMPEGLLDDMTDQEVTDLFSFLQTLK